MRYKYLLNFLNIAFLKAACGRPMTNFYGRALSVACHAHPMPG
jgi:hypothetical protein